MKFDIQLEIDRIKKEIFPKSAAASITLLLGARDTTVTMSVASAVILAYAKNTFYSDADDFHKMIQKELGYDEGSIYRLIKIGTMVIHHLGRDIYKRFFDIPLSSLRELTPLPLTEIAAFMAKYDLHKMSRQDIRSVVRHYRGLSNESEPTPKKLLPTNAPSAPQTISILESKETIAEYICKWDKKTIASAVTELPPYTAISAAANLLEIEVSRFECGQAGDPQILFDHMMDVFDLYNRLEAVYQQMKDASNPESLMQFHNQQLLKKNQH